MADKKHTLICLYLAFILASTISASTFMHSVQAQTTIMSISPPSVIAVAGQDFTINVDINGVLNLYGWEFKLSWNSTLLDAINAQEGQFLKHSGTTFFSYNVNATEGRMVVDCTLIGNVLGVSGDGTLANITFNVEDGGQSVLDLFEVTLLDPFEQQIPCEVLDGYGSFTYPHDVAVTNVAAWPITVLPGTIVNIDVTVQNQGSFDETFNITIYADSQFIESETVFVSTGLVTGVAFNWNTADFGKGDYSIIASASVVQDETDIADNNKTSSDVVTILHIGHDVAITSVQPAKTVIGQRYVLKVAVKVKNYGTYTETLTADLFVNTTTIQTQSITLTSGEIAQLNFTWGTVGYVYAFTITATAMPVQGEVETADNSLTFGIVKVSCIGDIGGDYITDSKDFVLIKKAIPSISGSSRWNPNADINCDNLVDAKDYQILKNHIPSHV